MAERRNATETYVLTQTGLLVPKSLFDANTILKADSDDTPVALTVGASTFVGRKAAGSIAAMTPTEAAALLTDLVPKSLYDANTVLAATTDDTPAAITMGASTILARLAAGNIVAATVAQIATLLAPSLPGYKAGYAEITSAATSTATSAATATAAITLPSVTFDGTTEYWFVFSCVSMYSTVGQTIIELYEDTTDVGLYARTFQVSSNNQSSYTRIIKRTPAAGAKVYSARMWTTLAGTATMSAGAVPSQASLACLRAT